MAVLGVPQDSVEEGLGGKEGEAEHSPKAGHKLVPRHWE